MKIVLIRHPKPMIAPGLCYGRLDVAADPDASDALVDLALSRAAGAMQVWTSPARRCRAFAETLARHLLAPVSVDARLAELDFGDWEGLAWERIDRAALDAWAAAPSDFAPPGGETGGALIKRVMAFSADLRRAGGDCVVVTHGGVLKVLAPSLTGEPVDLFTPAPPIGSINTIVVA